MGRRAYYVLGHKEDSFVPGLGTVTGALVTGAGWSVIAHIAAPGDEMYGSGLHILFATFRGTPILRHGCLPFALVQYQAATPGTFRDGLGGVPFRPLTPWTSPTIWTQVQEEQGALYLQCVVPVLLVEESDPSDFEMATLRLSAKFGAENYQYVHQWTFYADGRFEPGVALGGSLLSASQPTTDGSGNVMYGDYTGPYSSIAHTHNFYFRLEFGFSRGAQRADYFAYSPHNWATQLYPVPQEDYWTNLNSCRRIIFSPGTASRLRIRLPRPRHDRSREWVPRGYEIRPHLTVGPDGADSTGDMWVVPALDGQLGSSENDTTDAILSTYGDIDSSGNGANIGNTNLAVWYCLRELHFPRWRNEEAVALPFHSTSFEVAPLNAFSLNTQCLYVQRPTTSGLEAHGSDPRFIEIEGGTLLNPRFATSTVDGGYLVGATHDYLTGCAGSPIAGSHLVP